jgi:hypothetical protein
MNLGKNRKCGSCGKQECDCPERQEDGKWREETNFTGPTGWKKPNPSLTSLQKQLIGEFEKEFGRGAFGDTKIYINAGLFVNHAIQLAWEGGVNEWYKDEEYDRGFIAGMEKAKELVDDAKKKVEKVLGTEACHPKCQECIDAINALSMVDQTLSAYKEGKV